MLPTTPRRPFVSTMKAFFQSEEKEPQPNQSINQSNNTLIIGQPNQSINQPKPAFIVAPPSPRKRTSTNQSPPSNTQSIISRLRPANNQSVNHSTNSENKKVSLSINQSTNRSISQFLQNEQEVLDLDGDLSQSTNQSVNQIDQSINQSINQELFKLVKTCTSINQVDRLINFLESWLKNMLDASHVRVWLVQSINQSTKQSNNQSVIQSNNQSNTQSNNLFGLQRYTNTRLFPVSGLVQESINQSINQPINNPSDHPLFDGLIDSMDDQSIINTINQYNSSAPTSPVAMKQSINQSINQSHSHSMIVCPIWADSDQSIKELIGVVQVFRCTESINQSTNQSNNQTINQSMNFTINHVKLINQSIAVCGNLLKSIKRIDGFEKSINQSTNENRRINALLDVARILSTNQSINQIVKIIVRLVPELIDCDRCTVFFVDQSINQLIVSKDASSGRPSSFLSWIFGQSINQSSLPFLPGKQEIRLPMIGLAGHVALTGQSINIIDAHLDSRFNSLIDKETGYRTRSLLAVPMIDGNGEIIGVVQAINKSFKKPINQSINQSINQWEYGEFTQEDEVLLSTFSAQAALAVRTSQLFHRTINQLSASEAMLEVTQALSSELKIDSLISIICSKVQQIVNSERCTVFIIDQSINQLYTSASMSYGMGPALPIDHQKNTLISFPLNRGIAGAVATSGQSINIADAYKDERFNQSMDKSTGYRTRSILCMPIKNHRGETSGVLQVMNKRANNQSINQSINKLTRQSSDVTGESINQSINTHRSTSSISQSIAINLNSINQSITDDLIDQPINSSDDQSINQSILQFTDEDEQMLQSFCAQAAVALENSRLFTQTERALNQSVADQRNLKFMFSVTKNLFSDLHLTSMIDQMTMQVHHLLKADDCALYLVDSINEQFWLAKEVDDQSINQSMKKYDFSVGIVGYVARTGECVRLSENASRDNRFHPTVDQRRGRITHSILCCPIKAELQSSSNQSMSVTKIVGVMSVRDEKHRGGFECEEEKLLKVFCAQASLAIMNSQRFATLMSSCHLPSRDTSASDYLKVARGMNLASDDIGTFQFRMDELTLQQSIGTGSYGEVFKATVRGSVVAVKKLHVRSLQAEQVDSFCKEASLMCQLDHPNIVTFIGAVTEPSHLCILTQYCSRGSLADLLLEPTIEMNFHEKLRFSSDAANGMAYLHRSNPAILHRDLKSDNLLVTQDWTVKVGDFGLTRFLNEKKPMTQVGTPMWMAPEIIMGKNYTEKADVYAFGIILWEILTREEPYEEKEPMQIVVEVVNEGLRPTIKDCYANSPLIPLMTDCWATEPDQRPTFEKIVERLMTITTNIGTYATTEYGF